MSNTIDLSDLLSLASIIISVGVAGFTICHEKKAAHKEHEFLWWSDLFREHLMHRIPEARAHLHVSDTGYVTGAQPLVNELIQIRKDALYYFYSDNIFFTKLKKHLQDLEDELIMTEEKTLPGEDAQNFLFDVERSLNKIYKCILKKM